MKVGIRKPSLKKSLKARTTGKLKRSVKKDLIPGYGKKGMGWIKNPKKAAYNKIYNKTSVSLFPAGTSSGKMNRKGSTNIASAKRAAQPTKKRKTWLWVLGWFFIFPVPLTILMVRNQKLNKLVKIGIIAVAWVLYLIIALA